MYFLKKTIALFAVAGVLSLPILKDKSLSTDVSREDVSFLDPHDNIFVYIEKSQLYKIVSTTFSIPVAYAESGENTEKRGMMASIFCSIKEIFGSSCEVPQEPTPERIKEETPKKEKETNNNFFMRKEDAEQGDDNKDTQIIYKEVPVQTNSTNPNSYTKQETLSLLARLKNEILNIIPSETTTIVERTSANTASVDYDRIYNVINKNIENVYEALGDRTEGEDSTTNFNGSS